MRRYYKAFALALLLPLSAADAVEKDPDHLLTCKKLGHILIHHPANAIRPYCNTAEIKCRSRVMVDELPKNNVLRQEVDGKLKEELRYELDLCEIALRRLDPDFLADR